MSEITARDETNPALQLAPDSSYQIGSPGTATVAIGDNDLPYVAIDATDADALESGDPGSFTILRTGNNASPLVVSYTVTGTATNGVDYISIASPVIIPAGTSSVVIPVTPVDDTQYEGGERVTITISPSRSYWIASHFKSDTVTIADNDLPAVTIKATDSTAGEPSRGPVNVGRMYPPASVIAQQGKDFGVPLSFQAWKHG